MNKMAMITMLAFGILLSCAPMPAQTTASTPTVSDQDIQLLRKDLRSVKKQIVAANVELTDVEAQKFWPVYDEYTAEAAKVNDAKVSIIKDYAANYENFTDAQADDLIKRWAAADQSAMQLRMKYLPLFQKVLSGKKAARFFQIDRRIAVLTDLQLASNIPLVEP